MSEKKIDLTSFLIIFLCYLNGLYIDSIFAIKPFQLFLPLLIIIFLAKKTNFSFQFQDLIFVIFLSWSLISLLFPENINHISGIRLLGNLSIIYIYYLLAKSLLINKSSLQIALIILYSAFIYNCLSILVYLEATYNLVGFADILKSRPLGRVISAYRTPRMSGLEIDPNYFVLYLTPGLLLSLWAILDRQRLINRKLCYLVFISSLFCLFFSLSRTGIVINIFFVFLSFLFMAKRIRFQHIFIAAMIGCFLLLPIFKEIIRRFELLKYEFKGIGMGRYSLLLFGLDLFKKAPILGIGFNQYAEYYARYHGQIRYAHNTFLSILVELGIVGLTLYLLFLSIILKNVYKAIKVNASKYTWIFQAFTMVLLSQIVQIGSLFAITSSALWMSLIVVSLLILNSKKMEQGMY